MEPPEVQERLQPVLNNPLAQELKAARVVPGPFNQDSVAIADRPPNARKALSAFAGPPHARKVVIPALHGDFRIALEAGVGGHALELCEERDKAMAVCKA